MSKLSRGERWAAERAARRAASGKPPAEKPTRRDVMIAVPATLVLIALGAGALWGLRLAVPAAWAWLGMLSYGYALAGLLVGMLALAAGLSVAGKSAEAGGALFIALLTVLSIVRQAVG